MKYLLFVMMLSGCARTTFYHEGKPVADFQGDMINTEFYLSQSGDYYWKSQSVDHSSATLAQGTAASNKISAAGTALGAAGAATLFLK
jgi:hypothetical protein